jgi:hypothetical protein
MFTKNYQVISKISNCCNYFICSKKEYFAKLIMMPDEHHKAINNLILIAN